MAAAAAAKKMTYEFTTDDDELNEDKTTDQGTMCNFYKINLPASASILSKQIAKSQAKRAKKEERSRRRVDLSTVREQDETKLSASEENSSPLPARLEDVTPSAPASQYGGRSRIDSAPLDVKLKRQSSLPEEERKAEPMDEEEAGLLAMLLSGIEHNQQNGNGGNIFNSRKFSLPPLPTIPGAPNVILPSPGLPRMPPGAKVSEWLLERSASPDNVSVVSSVLLEDSGLVLSYANDDEDDDDDDVFFDAPEETEENVVDLLNGVEHDMQGLSLNRNMAAMTQSLVRVEEETVTDGHEPNGMPRTGRSTSVSPRPSNEQFVRNTNGSATFNVKHSSTLARLQKFTPPTINGNMSTTSAHSQSQQLTATPLSSRTTRSVLRVHNVNSINHQPPQHRPMQAMSMSKSTTSKTITNPGGVTNTAMRSTSGIRQPDGPVHSTPLSSRINPPPPAVLINPSTPSRPASVASSAGRSAVPMSNLEGLQDLIQMQEDALRRAALDPQGAERKMSWQSDHEANRQSTSTHSSLGSICSSKSIDGAHALNKLGSTTPASRIPTPRSRLPTPRGSNLPKRVSIGIQTDIPWPPPCVLRHRSLSLPALFRTEEIQQMTSPMSVSEAVVEKKVEKKVIGKPPRGPSSSRRMVRSLFVSNSNSYDSSTPLASFLLVPQVKK